MLNVGRCHGVLLAALAVMSLTFTALQPSLAYGQCGNGIVNIPDEDCDDGNLSVGDGCNNRCRTEQGYVCPGPETPMDLYPVGWWRLGERVGSTTVDRSTTDNHGTYTHYDGPVCAAATDCMTDETCTAGACVGGTGPTLGQTGLTGVNGDGDLAPHFDGWDDYVQVTHNAAYLADAGAFSVWFNIDALPVGKDAVIFSKDAVGTDVGGHITLRVTSAGVLYYRLQHGGPLLNDGDVCTAGTDCDGGSCTDPDGDLVFRCTGSSHRIQAGSITPGTWYHAVATFGPAGMELYLDGASIGTDPHAAGIGPSAGNGGNTEPIAIGAGRTSAVPGTWAPLDDFFEGYIDELMFFDRQLTAAEVAMLYPTSLTGGACTTGTSTTCGDGRVQAGEGCDDTNVLDGDGCSASCIRERCGDGVVNNTTEACDDGNLNYNDGCSPACAVEAGWMCNTTSDPSVCAKIGTCGNGTVEGLEECDDMNVVSGDGCSDQCITEFCGDGIVNGGETCDDLNTTAGDGCDATCQTETGFSCTSGTDPYGPLPTICTAVCGDGTIAGAETCDDSNTVAGDGCDEYCQGEVCGDRRTQVGEGCDDGNTVAGDGCSATCTVEAGYVCGTGGCIPQTACDPGSTVVTDTSTGSFSTSGPFSYQTYNFVGAYDMAAFNLTAGQMFIMDHASSGYSNLVVTVDMAKPEACTNGFCGGATTCTVPTDCGAGEVCYSGICRPTCSTAADCPGSSCSIDTNADLVGDACSNNCSDSRECGPDATGWVNVVNAATNNFTTSGDDDTFDAEFTASGSYSHGGGWLLVRYKASSGGGNTNHDYGSSTRRMFRDADGVWPWDTVWQTYYAPAFQIRTLSFPCVQHQSEYQPNITCSAGGECTPPVDLPDCPQNDFQCGYGYNSTCSDCSASDRWWWNQYNCCSGSDACTCKRLYQDDGVCYSGGKRGYFFCTYYQYIRKDEVSNCRLCQDSDTCTSDYCSGGTCYASELGGSSCYEGPPSAASVGTCTNGLSYCRSPGVCYNDVWPIPELCDLQDNDCDLTADDTPDANAVCDDGLPNTVDECVAGVCQNTLACLQTDTSCDDGLGACVDCNAQDAWYDTSAPYACCSGGASCTCTPQEYRDYVCDTVNGGCVYVVTSTQTAITGCTNCDDANLCTNDSCNGITGLCENPNNTYSQTCYTGPGGTEGIGVCYQGTETCSGGSFGACSDVTPSGEVCDGFDNDCNNMTDDGTAEASCAAGTSCWWGACDTDCTSNADCGATEFCYFENGITPGRCAPQSDACADVTCANGATCFEGSCTNTNCGNDADCNIYSKCYNSGRCLNDKDQRCNGVQCPQGDECIKGTCKKPCNANADCNSGESCFQNYCFPDTDPCLGVDCQVSETCWQGSCYPQCTTTADCTDPNDVCWDATRCAPATDPCANVNCAIGDVCYQGACYPDCSASGCTDPADSCYDASRCATDNCQDVQCPVGEACQGGICYLSCTDDIDCSVISSSHFCWGGFCKTGPCDGVQCAAGEVCSQGVCYVSCTDDIDCQAISPSHFCYGGYCTDDPCSGVLCPTPSEICYGGACFPYCNDPVPACTDPGDICYDVNICGTDYTDLCAQVVCPTSQSCYAGSCYYDCTSNADCSMYDPSHFCYDGRCAGDACDGVTCEQGEICSQGTCYQYCTTGADCTDPNHICYDNTCRLDACDGVVCAADYTCYEGTCYQDCNGTVDCTDPSHVCYDNRCQDPCATTNCLAGETCYLGTCYEDCGVGDPCTDPNHVCYNDRCVDADDPWCDGVMCPTGESCYRGTCYNDCNSQADCDALPYDSICYQNKCLPNDCSGTVCDTGETCYNGACYEDCSGGLQCSDPNMACYDNRCAYSACEAQATTFLADYNANNIFRQVSKKLFAWQNSSPYMWPRPYTSPGDGFVTWADLGSGAGSSSNNDALYAKGAARVLLYLDDQDSNNYVLYLIHGSKDATQGAAEATYGIRSRNVTPQLIAMDDPEPDGEAFRVANKASGNWTYTQAFVTTGASETGGIALGKFNSSSNSWRIEISAQFSGDIDRWELMNGETGEPIRSLNVRDVLIIENKDLPGTEALQPDFGITQCDTDLDGICKPGLVNACVNWELQCVPTIGPWGMEICDGLDNNCNGTVDQADVDLKYPIVETRQSLLFGGWRAWPTADSNQTINEYMNFSGRYGLDRVGSTDVKRTDGTSLQNPATVYMVMHRHLETGQFSMPILVGGYSSDSDAIDDFGGTDFYMDVVKQPSTSSSVRDLWVCWYDDREQGPTEDELPKDHDQSSELVSLDFEIEVQQGFLESDSAVLRPNWHEAWSGRTSAYGVKFYETDDDDEERLWRRYSPNVGDLALTKFLRFWFRIKGTGPAESYCISDTPTPEGCKIGVYQCTDTGIECGPADNAICAGACGFDADGDGHTIFDPAFCPDGDDCDDYDAETYFGAPEMCNGRDNDCDTFVDHQSKEVQSDLSVIDVDPRGPQDCDGRFVCSCPNGEREEPGDPADKCICGESLTP